MEKNGEKNTRKKQQQSPKTCQSGEQLSQLELQGRASMENLGGQFLLDILIGHPWPVNQWLVGYLCWCRTVLGILLKQRNCYLGCFFHKKSENTNSTHPH